MRDLKARVLELHDGGGGREACSSASRDRSVVRWTKINFKIAKYLPHDMLGTIGCSPTLGKNEVLQKSKPPVGLEPTASAYH
jgi:hypothetical protein